MNLTPSVVATKYVILDNLSQTTKITLFPTINSNFVIKSTIKCVHSFSGTSLSYNFSTGASVLFLSSSIYYKNSHTFLHFLSLQATNNSLLPVLLFFIYLYILLLVYHGVTELSLLLMPYPLVHRPFFLLILNPSLSTICLLAIL